MKKVGMQWFIFVVLLISGINYGFQPQEWYDWARETISTKSQAAAESIKAGAQRLYGYVPRMNFKRWAQIFVNKLNFDQVYTLYRLLANALGIEQPEEPIQKEIKQEINLPSQIEIIEKNLNFKPIDTNNIYDTNNVSNMVIFLKEEESDWSSLTANQKTNAIKCTLFKRNIYPILQILKTEDTLLNFIFFILSINNRLANKLRTNLQDPSYHMKNITKYPTQCNLQQLWEEKKSPRLALSKQPTIVALQKNYGYEFKPIDTTNIYHENNLHNIFIFLQAGDNQWNKLQMNTLEIRCELFKEYVLPIIHMQKIIDPLIGYPLVKLVQTVLENIKISYRIPGITT